MLAPDCVLPYWPSCAHRRLGDGPNGVTMRIAESVKPVLFRDNGHSWIAERSYRHAHTRATSLTQHASLRVKIPRLSCAWVPPAGPGQYP